MSELVSCRDLWISFGARDVLCGVELALRSGEVVALLGPNGAGKSTLVRALAGVLRPSRGVVSARAPRARAIAYLSQNEALPPEFAVIDVVRLGRLPHHGIFGGDLLGRAEDRRAIERALALTETSGLIDRRVEQLSGGERQRVALARALAQEPAALLLDEPLTHLDVRHQIALLRTLREARDRGLGALLVLHDLALAAHADRCVLLDEGKILADGTPNEVLTAERLEQVYGVAFDIEERGGRPQAHARVSLDTAEVR